MSSCNGYEIVCWNSQYRKQVVLLSSLWRRAMDKTRVEKKLLLFRCLHDLSSYTGDLSTNFVERTLPYFISASPFKIRC